MKITALLVLKCNPEGSDPVILANAMDVSHFGYFQRSSVKEFIFFVGRTVAKRTPPGQRQSVQHEEYKVHTYNRNGLCALGFMDDHYPVRSAFSLLNQVIDEYQKNFGESWRAAQADSTQPWPYLNEALTKFQDPAEADKLLKIQRELDETKIILHKTIDSVLARGEKLDSLVEKSSDLSAASQCTDVLQAGKENQSMLYHTVGFQGKQPNATASHFICRGVEEAGGWQNCDCNMSISFINSY
ncbi:VAMP-like protein YKT61 [Populus alba x Populus x berolinensis]|nr:VAMP-like protein YKT61 [Populus alba x Populus x berolinensis]